MVSYLTVIAVGSSLASFLGLLLLLWGAKADLRPLMIAGLLVLTVLALAWSVWILAFLCRFGQTKLRKPE